MTATTPTADDDEESIEQRWIDSAAASIDELHGEVEGFLARACDDDADAEDFRRLERSAIETLLTIRDAAHTVEAIDAQQPRHEAAEDLLRAAHATDRPAGVTDAVDDRLDDAQAELEEARNE